MGKLKIKETQVGTPGVPTGAVIIWGINGAGKSTLACKMCLDETFNSKRIRLGNQALNTFLKMRGLQPRQMTHFTYVSEKATFKRVGYKYREGHIFEPRDLGIQREAPEGKKCVYMPAYSVWWIDEAQEIYPSRDGGENKAENYQYGVQEKKRHQDLYFIMTTPDAMLVDKRVRNSSSGIYIKQRVNTSLGDNRQRITWFVDRIPYGQVNNYLTAAPEDKWKYCKPDVITTEEDLYSMFNSKSRKRDFEEGLSDEQILASLGV